MTWVADKGMVGQVLACDGRSGWWGRSGKGWEAVANHGRGGQVLAGLGKCVDWVRKVLGGGGSSGGHMLACSGRCGRGGGCGDGWEGVAGATDEGRVCQMSECAGRCGNWGGGGRVGAIVGWGGIGGGGRGGGGGQGLAGVQYAAGVCMCQHVVASVAGAGRGGCWLWRWVRVGKGWHGLACVACVGMCWLVWQVWARIIAPAEGWGGMRRWARVGKDGHAGRCGGMWQRIVHLCNSTVPLSP